MVNVGYWILVASYSWGEVMKRIASITFGVAFLLALALALIYGRYA